MVSSLYSDLRNVDLGTNLTKIVCFSTQGFFFLLEHSRRFLITRVVLGHDKAPAGDFGAVGGLWDVPWSTL